MPDLDICDYASLAEKFGNDTLDEYGARHDPRDELLGEALRDFCHGDGLDYELVLHTLSSSLGPLTRQPAHESRANTTVVSSKSRKRNHPESSPKERAQARQFPGATGNTSADLTQNPAALRDAIRYLLFRLIWMQKDMARLEDSRSLHALQLQALLDSTVALSKDVLQLRQELALRVTHPPDAPMGQHAQVAASPAQQVVPPTEVPLVSVGPVVGLVAPTTTPPAPVPKYRPPMTIAHVAPQAPVHMRVVAPVVQTAHAVPVASVTPPAVHVPLLPAAPPVLPDPVVVPVVPVAVHPVPHVPSLSTAARVPVTPIVLQDADVPSVAETAHGDLPADVPADESVVALQLRFRQFLETTPECLVPLTLQALDWDPASPPISPPAPLVPQIHPPAPHAPHIGSLLPPVSPLSHVGSPGPSVPPVGPPAPPLPPVRPPAPPVSHVGPPVARVPPVAPAVRPPVPPVGPSAPTVGPPAPPVGPPVRPAPPLVHPWAGRGPLSVFPHQLPPPTSPTTFGEPWTRTLRACGVPYSEDPTVFGATLRRIETKLQEATGIRDPFISTMVRVEDPSPSFQIPGTRITAMRIVFSTAWARKCAFRARHCLKHTLITLVQDVPDEYEELRKERRRMLEQLPKGSLPTSVIGVDFYYIPPPSSSRPPNPEFNQGPWVWAPSFQALRALVSPPCPAGVSGPGHAHLHTGPSPSAPRVQQHPVSPAPAHHAVVAAAVAAAAAAAANRARRRANQALASPAQP